MDFNNDKYDGYNPDDYNNNYKDTNKLHKKIKNKIITATSTVLAVGTLLIGANIKIPVQRFTNRESNSHTTAIDFVDVAKNNYSDPTRERFIISGEYSSDYINASRMTLDADNTIKIAIQDGLSADYVKSVEKTCELYNNIFNIINPNIKVEIINIDSENINGDTCDIYVKKLAPEDEKNNSSAMETNSFMYGYNGEFFRPDYLSVVSIFNATDEKKQEYKDLALSHEFGHAICGFDDFLKGIDFFKENGIENPPKTIMNYNDFNKLAPISSDPKITTFDLALMVKQWGLFQGNNFDGEQYFENEQDYYDYINSRISEVCYNDLEMELAFNNDTVILNDYKLSFLDYLKICKDANSDENCME